MLGRGGKNQKLEKAAIATTSSFRSFNAMTADVANDNIRCLAELGKIISDINTVILHTESKEFMKGKERAGQGKFLVLDGEERELLDKVLSKTLKDATELARNGPSDTAWSYDRFRKMAIENRSFAIIQRFSIALDGLARFSEKSEGEGEGDDPNPYLLAFNKSERKKYEAAEARLKEDYVFYKLLQGDLRRYKACIMRVEHPYSQGRQADKARENIARESRAKEVEAARAAYQDAFNFARDQLPNTHPFALRIGLSFATMYYDFLDMPERAIELATSIHREVAPRVIDANKDQEASVRNAALPVLQELEERLFLWTTVLPMDSQDPKCYAAEDLDDMM